LTAGAHLGALSERDRILSFIHGIEERSSTRIVPFRWGRAFFNDDFPRSWAHNFLLVEGAPVDFTAEGLAAEADRLHTAAGHAHRQVEVDDEATGRSLQTSFERFGWSVDRLLAMAHRRAPDRPLDPRGAEEVGFDAVRPALERFLGSAPYGDSPETIRQLVERTLITAQATDVRHFAARVDGVVASTCQLYSDGRTAQIEDVQTIEDYRGRGLARATVSLALAEARAAGHDLVFLVADYDDWPKQMYARLGFAPAARWFAFTRPAEYAD
jgi:ribosomal protein S18 acetylase RimI-like enzyme